MMVALILGRNEARPFAGRNTFPLLGRPLTMYPILAASHCTGVDRVFFSTGEEAMAHLAAKHGATVIRRQNDKDSS